MASTNNCLASKHASKQVFQCTTKRLVAGCSKLPLLVFWFVGFLLLYAWGTYDAFTNYEKANAEIIKKMEERLKIVPKADTDRVGIALAWSF